MPFTVNQILRVAWYFAQGNKRAAVTRLYRMVSGNAAGMAAGAVLAKAYNDFLPEWQNLIHESTTIQGVSLATVGPTGDVDFVAEAGPQDMGLGSGDPLPGSVAGLISLYPLAGARTCKGRMYVPFASTTHNGPDARPTAAYIALLTALRAQLGVGLVVTQANPSPPPTNWTATFRATLLHGPWPSNTLVGQSFSRTRWATQRRRDADPPRFVSPFG